MSCKFNFCCLSCSQGASFSDLNWYGDELLAALKHRRLLEQLEPIFDDTEMWWFLDEASRLAKVADFFRRHRRHPVIVVSEYGQAWSGTCHDGNTGDGFCDLEKGHPGAHHYPKRLVWNDRKLTPPVHPVVLDALLEGRSDVAELQRRLCLTGDYFDGVLD